MAGSKNTVLLAAILVLTGSAAALDFNVEVAPTPEAKVYQPNVSAGNYFNATASIQNPGSIGCEFRVKGDIQQGDRELTRYSNSYSMWPGDTENAEFIYLPINYTGEVMTNLSLQYCDKSRHIGFYSFNYTDKVLPNKSIDSKTLDVNSSNALASIETDEALLIPQKYPSYWKVGSAKVEEGRAFIEYRPTLFRKGEEIVFTVVENKTVKGKTTVVLEDQESWYEELFRNIISKL